MHASPEHRWQLRDAQETRTLADPSALAPAAVEQPDPSVFPRLLTSDPTEMVMNTERTRAWRRAQRARIIDSRADRQRSRARARAGGGYLAKEHGWPWFRSRWSRFKAKKWRLVYLRSCKLARARQLGLPYPRRSWFTLANTEHEGRIQERLNVLFVCSKNQWRSPTAERLWRRDQRLCVRSAGTSSSAAHVLSWDDVAWADLVIVMEEKHKQRVLSVFGHDAPRIVVLDIPDEHRFMSPELVELLEAAVEPVLDEAFAARAGPRQSSAE